MRSTNSRDEGEPVSDELPDRVDPELEAFFAAERARPNAAEPVRHAALARVLGAATSPPVPVGISRLAAASMTVGALVAGLGLGALGHRAWVTPPTPSVSPEAPGTPRVEASAPDEPEEEVRATREEPRIVPPPPEPAPEVVVAPVDEPVAAPPPRSPEVEEESLGDEMALVARAQTALHRGLYASALSALDEHARRFPRGDLAEEREALAVQALARAGRDDEARARADRFESRYPRSVLVPVVRAAVDGSP
jgi:hypothetical protein